MKLFTIQRSHFQEYPLEHFTELLECADQKKLAMVDDDLVPQQLNHIKGMSTTDPRGFIASFSQWQCETSDIYVDVQIRFGPI